MLTGTRLDLTPFGSALAGLGAVYWMITAAAVWWAWKRAASRQNAMKRVLAVLLVFGIGPAVFFLNTAPSQHKKAMALFAERCKSSGETIKRFVENVDGVVWMKWREPYSNAGNFAEQFKLNDPFGRDCGAESCIADLLRVSRGMELNPQQTKLHSKGYRFVETIDPADGKPYRYIAQLAHSWSEEGVERHKRETGTDVPMHSYRVRLVREQIEAFTARYGLVWEDISTSEDRKHWIAGGRLRIVDLSSNETLAERLGYMIDQGQGSEEGGRSPWLFARSTACPALVDRDGERTEVGFTSRFALRVLRRHSKE
jgi:hypothetical protein